MLERKWKALLLAGTMNFITMPTQIINGAFKLPFALYDTLIDRGFWQPGYFKALAIQPGTNNVDTLFANTGCSLKDAIVKLGDLFGGYHRFGE